MKKILIILQLVIAYSSFGQVVPGQNFGTDASGAVIPLPIGGMVASTTTPLAANQSWSSDTFYYNGNNNIQLAIFSNVPGTYAVEYFRKNGSKVPFMGNVVMFDPSVVTSFQAGIAGKGDGVKITYVNGPVAQSSFYLEIGLFENTIQPTLRSIAAPMGGTNLASTTHAAIEGKDSSTAGAVYRQVTTSLVDSKVGIDVNVINRNNEQQSVNIPAGVNVNNFPAPPSVQTIAGSVSVSNFPAYPSTQTITGEVSVSNFDTSITITSPLPTGSNTIGAVNVNGTVPVSGTFWQATQPVSGTVNANVTFPSTQAVSGSVTVANPYSVNATDSNKYRKAVMVDNLPATYPITASSLPLPAGAATAANQSSLIASTGATADAAVIDPTQSATIISLLKGLLFESVAQATTGSFTSYSLAPNVAQTIPAQTGRKSVKITSVNGTILIAPGFTATATNYAYRIVTNATAELMLVDAALPVSIFSTTAATVNVATSN